MPSILPDSSQYDLACQLQACQSSSRRNGKVARLPQRLREQINHMLDDGIPYKLLIQALGPDGQHLNEDNLSNWRLGGYQDYLKAQAINERAQVQTEAAAAVVRDSGLDASQLEQACTQIALYQYMNTLLKHGNLLARDSLKHNPAKIITLINACCNLRKSDLAFSLPQPPSRKTKSRPAASPSARIPHPPSTRRAKTTEPVRT